MRKIRYKEVSGSLERMVAPKFDSNNRASIGMDKFVGEYYYIEVQKLVPYKNQARKIFDQDELKNLADTIREHGIRQPLTVLKSLRQDGVFEVVSGERRLKAAMLVGLEKVPCIIIDDEESAAEIALIENIQRQDLHPIELARGLKLLVDKIGWGAQSELERKLGLPQSRISEYLSLLQLTPEMQDLAIQHNYTGRDNLLSLLKVDDAQQIQNRIMGKASESPAKTSFSVLRVSFNMGEVKVQNAAFKKLSSEQKNAIKDKLQQLIDELN